MDLKYHEKYRQLGLNIAYYRKLKGYTQWKLAELLDVDRHHVGNIETARSGVSLDVLFRIAEILDVPVYKLLDFRD